MPLFGRGLMARQSVDERMTKEQFISEGEELIRKIQASDGPQGYFRLHASRLHRSCERFGLFGGALGNVLEIGPFYGLTPFLLRKHCATYTVLEGPDPAVRPLEPIYEQSKITLSYSDFFEVFGPTRTAPHTLAFPDHSVDTILCWETMEHFNFNPVKFVRELHRILKPGGRVCITVPNKASFQSVVALVLGRGEKTLIQNFYHFEDYESDGKKAFYGFHWREYSPPELAQLFSQAGFNIRSTGSFTAFQDHGTLGIGRRLARKFSEIGTSIFPRYGTHVYLEAGK
jgi:SAM-dependent methyltransferase